MASGVSKTVSHGSEEAFDVYCSPCREDGKFKEGMKYCVECGVHYCEECMRNHNRIPAVKGHQILDKSVPGGGLVGTALPSDRCRRHHGKLMDMYCGDHEEVCCSACIAIKHRTCAKVDYLPDITADIKDSKEYKDVKENIDHVLTGLKEMKSRELDNISKSEQRAENMLEEINVKEEELKQRVSVLADKSRKELQLKRKEIKTCIEKHVESIEETVHTLGFHTDKLSVGNDSEIFAAVKTGKKVIKQAEQLMKDASYPDPQSLQFDFNGDLEQLLHKLDSLGTLRHVTAEPTTRDTPREYTASLVGKYKVTDSGGSIASVCILGDGTAILCSNRYNDYRLVRVTTDSLRVIEEQKMDKGSCSVCSVGSNEVAVALINVRKIQFVSVTRKMTLTRSFATDIACWRIAYDENIREMYISNGFEMMKVYDLQGNCLRTIQFHSLGDTLFSNVRNISWTDDKSTIFVSDYKKGLVALDTLGTLAIVQWRFSDQEVRGADGLCVLPGDIILIAGNESNNIIQVDKNVRKIGTLVGPSDGLVNPMALAYDRATSRLIIGHRSNEVFVYKLAAK